MQLIAKYWRKFVKINMRNANCVGSLVCCYQITRQVYVIKRQQYKGLLITEVTSNINLGHLNISVNDIAETISF